MGPCFAQHVHVTCCVVALRRYVAQQRVAGQGAMISSKRLAVFGVFARARCQHYCTMHAWCTLFFVQPPDFTVAADNS
jgi:hypothetical protein